MIFQKDSLSNLSLHGVKIEFLSRSSLLKFLLLITLCLSGQQVFGQTTSELLERAAKAADAEKYDAALSDLNTVLNSEPDNLQALRQRMWVYYYQDKDDSAYADADKLIQRAPDFGEAYYIRGYIKNSRKKYGDAILDYDQAARFNPNLLNIYYHRALSKQALDLPLSQIIDDYSLYFQKTTQPSLGLKRAIRLIDYCILRGAALSGCAPYFEKFKKEYPDSPIGYFGYAASYSQSQLQRSTKIHWDAIAADFKRAAELLRTESDPTTFITNLLNEKQTIGQSVEAVLKRATEAVDDDKYDGALVDLNLILEIEPNNLEALKQRMWVYFNKKNYDLTYTEADKLTKLDPGFADAFNVRGIIRHKRKEYNEAVSDFDQALRLKADYTAAFKNRALSKISLNMPLTQVLADYDAYFQPSLKNQRALEAVRSLIDYCIVKGEALTICAPYFEKIKKEHPHSALGFFGYAASYSISQNQKDESIPWNEVTSDLKRAAELSPNMPEPLTFLASLMLGRGDYENAVKYSKLSADIDRNWA